MLLPHDQGAACYRPRFSSPESAVSSVVNWLPGVLLTPVSRGGRGRVLRPVIDPKRAAVVERGLFAFTRYGGNHFVTGCSTQRRHTLLGWTSRRWRDQMRARRW